MLYSDHRFPRESNPTGEKFAPDAIAGDSGDMSILDHIDLSGARHRYAAWPADARRARAAAGAVTGEGVRVPVRSTKRHTRWRPSSAISVSVGVPCL